MGKVIDITTRGASDRVPPPTAQVVWVLVFEAKGQLQAIVDTKHQDAKDRLAYARALGMAAWLCELTLEGSGI